jgi:hypothetical protein
MTYPLSFTSIFFIVSCASGELPPRSANDPANPNAEEAPVSVASTSAVEHEHHDAAPASSATVYTCPMHPEVTSDKPGNCPKCGMKLVPKKDQ